MSEFKLRKVDGEIMGCDACRQEVPVADFKAEPFQRPIPEDGMNHFCEVCANTFSGNSFVYPNQYPAEIMQHIAACTNIILAAITKGKAS